MIDPLPRHPYAPGTRVHYATEDSVPAFARGTADILGAEPRGHGAFLYRVQTDDGELQRWESYFTIAAGTWPGPEGSDPLFGSRSAAEDTPAEPARGTAPDLVEQPAG